MADLTVPTFRSPQAGGTTRDWLARLADVGPAEYVGPNTAAGVASGIINDDDYARRLNASEWRANVEHLLFLVLGGSRQDYVPPIVVAGDTIPAGKYFRKWPYGAAYTKKGIPLTDDALIARVREILA